MTEKSKWDVFTYVWGIVISVVTVWVAVGQWQLNSKAIRPDLSVSLRSGPPKFMELYGDYSHVYEIKNLGSVGAGRVSIHVKNTADGEEIYSESIDPFDMSRKDSTVLRIRGKDHQLMEKNVGNKELAEYITITYEGEPWLWVFRPRIFEYRLKHRYFPDEGVWLVVEGPTEKRI